MNYKYIIFDFDGVLVETNVIRLEGFRLLFENYPQAQLETLMAYARDNGGMSRYEKIRYFFEQIRHEAISAERVQVWAKQYSNLVKQKVIAAASVKGSLEFLTSYANNYDFAIVSSSEQEELREVCRARGIEHFFVEILGSPLNKTDNICRLLSKRRWKKECCLFVGDSINDLDAAQAIGIEFVGRDAGQIDWHSLENIPVISDLSQLQLYIK